MLNISNSPFLKNFVVAHICTALCSGRRILFGVLEACKDDVAFEKLRLMLTTTTTPTATTTTATITAAAAGAGATAAATTTVHL
jgi:hypothetical protein